MTAKVCIALDYNTSAEKIAEIGYAYAKAFNAEVMIIHVYNDIILYNTEDESAFGFSALYYNDEVVIANLMKENMENYLAASKKHLNDDKIQTQLLHGNIEDEILNFVKT